MSRDRAFALFSPSGPEMRGNLAVGLILLRLRVNLGPYSSKLSPLRRRFFLLPLVQHHPHLVKFDAVLEHSRICLFSLFEQSNHSIWPLFTVSRPTPLLPYLPVRIPSHISITRVRCVIALSSLFIFESQYTVFADTACFLSLRLITKACCSLLMSII